MTPGTIAKGKNVDAGNVSRLRTYACRRRRLRTLIQGPECLRVYEYVCVLPQGGIVRAYI